MIKIEVKSQYKFFESCDEPDIRYSYCQCSELLAHLQELNNSNWIPVDTKLCDEYGRYLNSDGQLIH